jgi:hypothetical protein
LPGGSHAIERLQPEEVETAFENTEGAGAEKEAAGLYGGVVDEYAVGVVESAELAR